jgi:sugar lactone lactonase YvrE
MRSNRVRGRGGDRRRRLGTPLVLAVIAASLAAGTASGQQAGPTGTIFKVVGKWGKIGTKGNGVFSSNVGGIAVDRNGDVYVADTDNHRIQVFSPKGAFKRAIEFGTGMTVPDVAIAPDGFVWGTTQVLTEVRRYPKAGGAAETLNTPKSAEGIAIDAAGNVYVSTLGDNINAVVRFDKSDAGWAPARTWVGGGLQAPGDVEVSPDGTIYVADLRGAPPNVKRYDASGKLLNVIKVKMQATAGAGVRIGLGVDPDCNLWTTNYEQRNMTLYSPTGKLLGTASIPDLLANDVAVGPTGDLYVFQQNTGMLRFAPDTSKPASAVVGGTVTVSGGVAKVKYTLTGVSCPAQVDATASLSGAVNGKAAVKVAAGKSTVISIPAKGKSGTAQFKIVLKTNGRPTTQTASVKVSAH